MEKNNYIVPVSILVAGLIIASSIIYYAEKNSNIETQQKNPIEQTTGVDIKNVKTEGEAFIGNPNAPVTLAYWFDFQCPFCKRFETQTLPILIDKYVKTGKLKVLFKDYQFLGSDSETAGIAKRAIWETSPKNYFIWQTAMYEKQDAENSGFGNKEDIINLIRTIPGINAEKVSKLMNDKKQEYLKLIRDNQIEGTKFGIKGTPGFVIGNQMVSGAQPASVFETLIDAELNK